MSGLAHANYLIPTCDTTKHDVDLANLPIEDLNSKILVYEKRRDYCLTAGGYLELYKRGLESVDDKKEVLSKIFYNFKMGKYLNNYTNMLLGLKDELPLLNHEKINEDHVQLYYMLITKPGTNPASQFTMSMKTMLLFDEIKIVFNFFIKNYPNNQLSKTLRKKLTKVHDSRLGTKLQEVEFYINNRPLSDPMYNMLQFQRLAILLSKSKDSRYYAKGLYFLSLLLKKAVLGSELKISYEQNILHMMANNKKGKKIPKKAEEV